MKILFINNAGLTAKGDDFFLSSSTGEFAKELSTMENEVVVFGQKLKPIENTVHVYGIKKNGLKVSGLWRRKNKVINYVLLYLKLIPLVWSVDFIYIFIPNAFKYVAVIAKLFRKKYGLYIRGEKDLNKKSSYWMYKNAFTVFTISDNFSALVNNVVGKSIANTIRPMIDFSENDTITNREYYKTDNFQLLFVGRTASDKGIIELLHAVSKLKTYKKKWILKIVGNGEYFEELKYLSKHLELDTYVEFEGGVYDPVRLRQYYIKSDIYILPTYHEGFPRTLYEAMIFGTPIITTFVGAIPGLMINNINCKEIKPKSVSSIVNSLTYAMNHYSNMGTLAKNGTQTVLEFLESKKLSHAEHLNKFI